MEDNVVIKEGILIDVYFDECIWMSIREKNSKNDYFLDYSPYFYISSQKELNNNDFYLLRNNLKGLEEIIKTEKKNANFVYKLLFDSIDSLVISRDYIFKYNLELSSNYNLKEFDIPFLYRFFIDKKLSNFKKIKFTCNFKKILSFELLDDTNIEDLKYLTYDIEVLNTNANLFPTPNKNKIISISTIDQDNQKNVFFLLDDLDINSKKKELENSFSNTNIYLFTDEAKLISSFAMFVGQIDPDLLLTYNGDQFDFNYIFKRYKLLTVNDLTFGSRKIQFYNRGKKYVLINGIIHLDVYVLIRLLNYLQVFNYSKFDLTSIYTSVTGNKKLEMPPQKIMDNYNSKNLKSIIEYNIDDVVATQYLGIDYCGIVNEIAKIIHSPFSDVLRSSAGSMVERWFINYYSENNMLIPNKPSQNVISERYKYSFEGAFVKKPLAGLHQNLAIVDFRSYHISLIIAYNISPETIDINSDKEYQKVLDYKIYKEPKGFVPYLLEKMLSVRIPIKKKIKTLDKGSSEYKKLYAKQYALKILLASTYGYMGFSGARWYCRNCLNIMYYLVRTKIQDTIKTFEDKGYTVVYGDSVTEDSKILLDNYEYLQIKELWDSKKAKKRKDGKEEFIPSFNILTCDGKKNLFVKPKKFIRHKVKKNLYTLYLNNTDKITVTEDHSLICLNKDLKFVEKKPSELNIGDKLIFSSKIPLKNIDSGYKKYFYEFLGYFMGNGYLDKKYYINLSAGKNIDEVYNKIIVPLEKDFNIKLTKKKNNNLRGYSIILYEKLINLGFDRNSYSKRIPSWLFKETENNITSFLRGYFSADGTIIFRANTSIIRVTGVNKKLLEDTRILLMQLGIGSSIITESKKNKYDNYINKKLYHLIIINKNKFKDKVRFILDKKNKRLNRFDGKKNISQSRKKALITIQNFFFNKFNDNDYIERSIKRIEIKKVNNKYVYDFSIDKYETFYANNILVHNTDSCFVHFEKLDNLRKDLEQINKSLPGAMFLEMEDIFKTGIFVYSRDKSSAAKKKYALLKDNGELKIKGFEYVRRDWAPLVKETQKKVLEIVLSKQAPKEAVSYVKDVIKKLQNKEITKDKLIIQSFVRKNIDSYKSINPAMSALQKAKNKNQNIKEREVIEYIITDKNTNTISEKSELAEYVKNGDYDVDYYINHQLIPAIYPILEVFDISKDELLTGQKQSGLNDYF